MKLVPTVQAETPQPQSGYLEVFVSKYEVCT